MWTTQGPFDKTGRRWGGSLGPSKQHRTILPRMRLLRALLDGQGSSEAVARALLHSVKGAHAQQRSVRNGVYSELTRTSCAGFRRVSISFDGATHGGHEVQVGLLCDIGADFVVYVKPKARARGK